MDLCFDFVVGKLLNAYQKFKTAGETAFKIDVKSARCFKCGKRGHLKRDCQVRTSNAEDEANCAYSFSAKMDLQKAWVLDSGASRHMTGDRNILKHVERTGVEPWKEEAGLGMALLLIGGANNHIGGAITKLVQKGKVPPATEV
jgi:hypothetical protein